MSFFLVALALSAIFTFAAIKIFTALKIMDLPDGERKFHNRPVPLWGGMAIFLSFWLIVGYLAFFTDLLSKHYSDLRLVGLFIGSVMILILGMIDDKKNLSPKIRLIVTALAALSVIMFGVHLDGITNPFGGILSLDQLKFTLPTLGTFFVLGDLLVFFWLMGMMYTTKILDGVDGLSVGIAAIGGIMIFLLSTATKFRQADTALIALVFVGVCLGFLLFNFYPAKIFLGESGSLLVGYILGILAIISGGKIATALLVMGVPILDLARVIIERRRAGAPILKGDRRHLHFRLLDSGLRPHLAVAIYYTLALAFGLTTLFFTSFLKLCALLILLAVFFIIEWRLSKNILCQQKNK